MCVSVCAKSPLFDSYAPLCLPFQHTPLLTCHSAIPVQRGRPPLAPPAGGQPFPIMGDPNDYVNLNPLDDDAAGHVRDQLSTSLPASVLLHALPSDARPGPDATASSFPGFLALPTHTSHHVLDDSGVAGAGATVNGGAGLLSTHTINGSALAPAPIVSEGDPRDYVNLGTLPVRAPPPANPFDEPDSPTESSMNPFDVDDDFTPADDADRVAHMLFGLRPVSHAANVCTHFQNTHTHPHTPHTYVFLCF
eukprot:m.164243 g.164243  ORF g.164243 m.164243 type:complete len:250 (+) comp15222_c1_seq6:996-1745(+)